LFGSTGLISSARADTASGITIVGGAAIDFKNSSFDVGGKKLQPKFITLDISGALAYDKYYIVLNYDPTLKEHLEHDTDINSNGNQENTYLNITRLDYSSAIGMNVWRTTNIFAGWKYGETSVNSFSDIALITNPTADPNEINRELYFREEGPFLGASYGYKFNKNNNLNLSLAYAQMNGEVELKSIAKQQLIKGTTSGLSYGLEFTGPLSDGMIYRLGYKTHRYRFKPDEPSANGEDYSSDVTFNMFYFGFSNYF